MNVNKEVIIIICELKYDFTASRSCRNNYYELLPLGIASLYKKTNKAQKEGINKPIFATKLAKLLSQ